jgi:hypothetical protein
MAIESYFGTGACPPLEGGKEFENINCFERDAGIQMYGFFPCSSFSKNDGMHELLAVLFCQSGYRDMD